MNDIEENNKLIAEFIRIELFNEEFTEALLICNALDLSVNPYTHFNNVLEDVYLDDFKFNSSWDWLIPVFTKCWDKIEEFQFDTEKYDYATKEIFHEDYTFSDFIRADIESIYERVVEFIKWYNQQK